MRRREGCAGAVLLVLLAGCTGGLAEPSADSAESAESPASSAPSGGDDRLARVHQQASDDPAAVLAWVRRAYDRSGIRAVVTRSDGEQESSYAFHARGDSWRAESATSPPDEGDGVATALALGDEVCFDQEYRPVLATILAASYGVVEFDPEPWACAASDFGLTPMATFRIRREDPRWRIENLVTDDPAAVTVEVEQVDGQPAVRLTAPGITADGPLDPARPTYDLWIDGDLAPLRLATEGTTWAFEAPGDLDASLAAPGADERGSYGYATGPGHGEVKACRQSGQCGDRPAPELVWGDSRD